MNRVGIGFIVAACAVLVLFVVDALVSREGRFQDRVDAATFQRIEKVDMDEVRPPVPPDPTWDLTTLSRDDVLTSREADLAARERDYTYTIRDGDTIDDLARKYLGDHALKSVLYDYNPSLVRGDRLIPGRKIVIPFRYRR